MAKRLHVYEVIFQDGANVYREVIPAFDKKSMLDEWGGNGEVVRVKDVTEFYGKPHLLCEDAVLELQAVLKMHGYGDDECDIIRRTLMLFGQY